MPKRSNLFQDVVAIIHRHLAGDAVVEESGLLPDKVTGQDREVDVVIRTRVAGQDIAVAVEATATGRAADAPWVEKMLGKHADLPTNKLVLVSQAGFTRPARVKAENSDAVPIEPVDLVDGDSAFMIVNRLKSIWPKTVSLTPEQARITVRRPDGKVVWFKAPADLWVFLDDGQPVGTLVACLQTLIHRNFEKVISDINLADIAESRDEFFQLVVGSRWSVRIDDREVVLHVQNEDVEGPPELHRIEQLDVRGRAVIQVGKVDLTHHRLGEVTYAYGESELGDRRALFVVSEDETGGKLSIRFREQVGQASGDGAAMGDEPKDLRSE